MNRIAMISVHSSPLARLGDRESGGMSVYVRELSRELGRQGVAVDVYTRWNRPVLPQIVPFGERARVIQLQAGGASPIDRNSLFQHLPEFLCRLRQFQEEHGLRYDVIHSHYWLSGWVARLLRQRWDLPMVAMFHTLGKLKKQARYQEQESLQRIETERQVIAIADALVAASLHERDQMVSLYGASAERIRVIPCGVDLHHFAPGPSEEAKSKLGLSQHQRILLFVGRIEPLKGVDTLLRALALLRHIPDLHLLVIGGNLEGDGELANLRLLAHQLALADRVSFLGSVDQGELPTYYNAAEACVVPSHYESFCLVALEALACGTPVIASRVGGLTSIVYDGVNGLLVPWRNPLAFAERMELLLSNARLRSTLAAAARPSVEHLSWSAVAYEVLDLYRELVAGPLSRRACTCGHY